MEASPLVESIIATTERENMRGMRMVMTRESEFPTKLQAQLTGVGIDPTAREFANRRIDAEFQSNRIYLPLPTTTIPEIVIGSGYHAATYVATRVLMGKPAPIVLERDDYIGGAFAIRSADGTYPGVFNLNSRNRRGNPGLSGDNEAQLNYLPGAPIQASALSNAEYQSNADMAFITRVTLAQYAQESTFPGVEVTNVERFSDDFRVSITRDGRSEAVRAARVIDARGLGDTKPSIATSDNVLTFSQFLQRMTELWPLRGLRNVAVVGGGDSARCAIESLLGLGPAAVMAAAELDSVNRVDWYATDIPRDYDSYCQSNRGRYRALGRYLRPDKMGNQKLTVFNGRAYPVAFPGGPATINGRAYDLVILATGNEVADVEGLDWTYNVNVRQSSGSEFINRSSSRTLATTCEDDFGGVRRYRIGPRAQIEFDQFEDNSGVSEISNNRVAMFRLGTRTAALALQLD